MKDPAIPLLVLLVAVGCTGSRGMENSGYRPPIIAELPALTGRTAPTRRADGEPGFVIITIGAEGGVRRGDVFLVYDDQRWYAWVEVLKVMPRFAACLAREWNPPFPITLEDKSVRLVERP